MRSPRIVALDLSVTSTGVATREGPTVIKGYGQGMRRLAGLRNAIFQVVATADVVVLEGYSFNSKNSRAHLLGELGGVVRIMLFDNEIPYVDVPPASLKQYAAGRGNASKNDVLAAAIRRLGYPGSSEDEADGLWLYAMAADRYGLTCRPVVPASHRGALQKVQWPDLGLEGSGGDDGKEVSVGSRDDRGGDQDDAVELFGEPPQRPSSPPDITAASA